MVEYILMSSTKEIAPRIEALLSRNIQDVIDEKHLREALASGKKLRIKLGIDPTGQNIHIGRAVVLWKLKEFQDLGHKIVLIIGDFTAQIGDPSDKLEKRPFLSKEDIKKNLKNYLDQIGRIIDIKKTEVHYNSEWLKKMTFREISELADNFTFQQMLERRNFKDRLENHQEISLREGLYPLMQGYDSVAVSADVELGGNDQLFNLIAGRKIQERYGQKPQDILTNKMLIGLDGRKMSTSWGNVININDVPEEQFGKIMSIRDDLVISYFEFATDLSMEAIKNFEDQLKGGENPKNIKEKLGFELVKRYHGEKSAYASTYHFKNLFSAKNRQLPDDIPELKVSGNSILPIDLIMLSGAIKSRSEARRLIEQGGFDVDNTPQTNPATPIELKGGEAIRIGKKRFFRVIL
jgi:tyrosyl-tRNA synthetase